MLPRDHRAWVEVDAAALTHNIQCFQNLLGSGTQLLAVVKADAYGHGAVAVSDIAIACGVTWLGVATIEEGAELRRHGLQNPILLMGATNTPDEVKAVAHWQLHPTICTPKQALLYDEVLTKPLAVHLKIDTGMTRLGTPWTAAVDFLRLAHHLPQIQVQALYSHLATTQFAAGVTEQQTRFESVIATARQEGILPPLLHLANTAGTLLASQLHYGLVRVGIGLYGYAPDPALAHLPLRPVLAVRARITQLQDVPAGTGISYGHHFITQRPSTIATVSIGYADGLPRNLSNRIEVLVHHQAVPQVGAVTMDQCMIDATGVPQAQVGDVVTFLGGAFTAETWAEILGTISFEVLCGFKHRLPRLVKTTALC